MRRRLACCLAFLCAFNLLGPTLVAPELAFARPGDREGRAGARPQSEPSVDVSVRAHWQRVKNLMRQGEYDQARAVLEEILTITPGDPWAELYQALCELRMETVQTFPQLSPAGRQTLEARLRDEAKAQQRTAAINQTIERRIRHEQAAWDAQLARQINEAAREARRLERAARPQRQEEARAAKERLRVARVQQREREQQQAVERARPAEPAEAPAPTTEPAERDEPVTEPATPSEPTPEQPVGPSSVELEPVVVATPGEQEPVSPSLVGRRRPPEGGVQINAHQMHMSPDNKVAVAQGDVELIYGNAVLTCDRLTLFTDTKDAYAEGNVRLEDGVQVFRGEMAHYNFETKKGRFLQGSIATPPWFQHGRTVEHIAEGVYEVTPGSVTSCEFDPPHFKFYGRRVVVFQGDRSARVRNAALIVDRVPFLYLPFVTVADRQMPFYLIPGQNKRWGEFALGGYRYEAPPLPGGGSQTGTIKVDWRKHFLWGFGLDHSIDSPKFGQGLLKLYGNNEPNHDRPPADRPKGAEDNRYRMLWRHRWNPMPDTTVITDLQKYSDVDFRKEFLFREEYTSDDAPESFISAVTNTPEYSLTTLVKKRLNRFQTMDELLPQVTLDVRSQRIGESQLFADGRIDLANYRRERAHSDVDDDVVRADWFQQLKYAINWFRPVELTPRAAVRQTYYTKDAQGATREGDRHFLSGQFTTGVDASLKLFRLFPVVSNAFGLNLNWLRHVVTPSISYNYVHEPTVPNAQLTFPAASGPTNTMTFGLENKLQTRRPNAAGKLQSVDLARMVVSVPYEFHGSGNERGGALGDWTVDLEAYPWPWLRLETDTVIPARFADGSRDSRLTLWNFDLVMVGGRKDATAYAAPGIQAPSMKAFEPGVRPAVSLIPQGQWYLGYGHRYSQNDKTESVLQIDWRLTEKWQIGSFHRFTWKEVAGGAKRFSNLREYQYSLRRDLHDWIGELAYRVDREYGEELFFILTLKAFPEMPIEFSESYHQPKLGSQSSPFSPIGTPGST